MSDLDAKVQVHELAAGDRAALEDEWQEPRIVRVARTTASMLMVAGAMPGTERKFRRRDGKEVGRTGWHIPYLTVVTPEIEARIRRARMLHTLRQISWDQHPNHVLAAVISLVTPKTQTAERKS